MKVLIIDDDKATREMLGLVLTQIGAEILVADCGEEGLRKTTDEKPDLIVLDFMMPVMDGLQTCKAIRLLSQTPILMLSAVDNPCLVAELLNAGADDYLIKPVGVTMLIARVQKMLRRPAFQVLTVNA